MGSKIFLLLALSIVFALLLSSEVAARDLAETSTKTAEEGSSDSGANYSRGRVSGTQQFRSDEEAIPTYPAPCTYTCYGMCCSEAESKALEARTQVKPHN